MKEFTAEMLNTLTEAQNSLKGTREYYKFDMATYCKNEKGNWFFVGYYPPYTTGIIKTFKGRTYIITNNDHRYHVTDEVKKLLSI